MSLARKTSSGPCAEDLYERDFLQWLEKNAELLRQGRFFAADMNRIAEELADMGRSERRALASHLGILLLHLLKWRSQPENRSSSWRGSIYNSRKSIDKLLKESPSLERYVPRFMSEEYADARFNAGNESGLPESLFPAACPFTPEQALDPDFWPETDGVED